MSEGCIRLAVAAEMVVPMVAQEALTGTSWTFITKLPLASGAEELEFDGGVSCEVLDVKLLSSSVMV